MSFKVGDVVKLKSGGPKMTVSKPGRPGVLVRGVSVEGRVPVEGREPAKVFCKWFEKGDKSNPRRASFNQEDLELCEPEQEQKRELGYK